MRSISFNIDIKYIHLVLNVLRPEHDAFQNAISDSLIAKYLVLLFVS